MGSGGGGGGIQSDMSRSNAPRERESMPQDATLDATDVPDDRLPGVEQLAVRPGRHAGHIREDTNIEPVFVHSLAYKFHEEIIHSFCVNAMVDATPGSGCAALACIFKRIPYLGLCLSDNHKELLTRRLIHVVHKEMEKSDSPLVRAWHGQVGGNQAPWGPRPEKAEQTAEPSGATTSYKATGRP